MDYTCAVIQLARLFNLPDVGGRIGTKIWEEIVEYRFGAFRLNADLLYDDVLVKLEPKTLRPSGPSGTSGTDRYGNSVTTG